MQHRHDPAEIGLDDRDSKRRTGLIVVGVLAFLVLAGVLHLVGVLPPGA